MSYSAGFHRVSVKRTSPGGVGGRLLAGAGLLAILILLVRAIIRATRSARAADSSPLVPDSRTGEATEGIPAAPVAAAPRRAASPIRTILGTTVALAVAVTVALVGTGTSYALWNGASVIDASSVASGSTGITINGVANYPIPGLDLSKLSPGQSVLTPLTFANTGSTPLSVSVVSTVVSAQTNGLAGNLTIRLTESPVCTTGLAGPTGPMTSFSTTAAPVALPVGSALQACLEVRMNPAAPATVQGGTATFSLNVDAVQVRP